MTDKFCKDCKWFRGSREFNPLSIFGLYNKDYYKFSRCGRPMESTADLVSGHQKYYESLYCEIERKYTCGPEAKYFEEK